MPPRLSLSTAKSLSYRPRIRIAPAINCHRFAGSDARLGGQDASKADPPSEGPNMSQAPHVTEEQAAMDKSMGGTPPDISQGTPVKEIMERDEEAKENAPEVIKRKMDDQQSSQSASSSASPQQTRSYSTSARRFTQQAQLPQQSLSDIQDLVQFNNTMAQGLEYPHSGLGHKFPLPDVSAIPRTDHLKRRYDPVLDQITKMIMRHGKLSVAQKNMSLVLDHLRTHPPPQINTQHPTRTLLPVTTSTSTSTSTSSKPSSSIFTPRSALPLDPLQYLTTIIDSVAPLLKIRQTRGIAGGGASLPMPIPLGKRQRRRTAITWILDSAAKRPETYLADRVGKELVSVAEGRSGVWERRALVHKLSVGARSNVRVIAGGRRKKR